MSNPIKVSRTIIFSAPQGWGKSTKAQALRDEFGCACVVDEYAPGQQLTQGALHLTHCPPSECNLAGAELVARGWPEAS